MDDLSSKITGSTYTAAEFVQFFSEVLQIITNSGITPSDLDLEQVAKALSTQIPSVAFMTATGTMPTKVLTAVAPHQAVDSLVGGMELRFRSSDANVATGATLNVDGLGAKDVFKEDGSPLAVGDIITTKDARVRFDTSSGGRFLLINPQGSQSFRAGHIFGGLMTWIDSGGGVFNDVQIDACECRDTVDERDGKTTSTFVKEFDAAFAFGSFNGGWGGFGARGVGTTVYFFMIIKKDGTIDYGWDDAINAANLLAAAVVLDGTGWVGYRLMAPMIVDSITNTKLVPFLHDKHDLSHFRALLIEGTAISVATDAQATSGSAGDRLPKDIMAEVALKLRFTGNNGAFFASVGSTAESLPVPNSANCHVSTGGQLVVGAGTSLVPIDSSKLFALRMSNGDAALVLHVGFLGFYFNRRGG